MKWKFWIKETVEERRAKRKCCTQLQHPDDLPHCHTHEEDWDCIK